LGFGAMVNLEQDDDDDDDDDDDAIEAKTEISALVTRSWF
jgi:hypothetical protein